MNKLLKIRDIQNTDLLKFKLLISIIAISSFPFILDDILKYYILSFIFLFNLLYLFKRIFKHIYLAWINLGAILGNINLTILFTLLYFIVLTPLGLFFKLQRRDILYKKRFRDSRKSYWIKRTIPPSSMKWQY
jgi:hypothetical protein